MHTCPACGRPGRTGAVYCGHCGASLAAGAQPAALPDQHRYRGYSYRVAGTLLLLFGLGATRASDGVVVTLGLAGFILGGWLVTRGRRHTAKSADEVLRADSRPPVLYLRAFADDERGRAENTTSMVLAGVTEEEQIAHVLNEFGPCIAIGRPGEPLPELGAARLYVGGADWQQKVRELMDSARLIVFRAGTTEGVRWEIREAFSTLPLSRLLILVPFGEAGYEAFRGHVRRDLGVALPDFPPRAYQAGSLHGAIHFDSVGQPRFLTFTLKRLRRSMRRPIASVFRRALEPVYRAQNVPWREEPIQWFLVYVYLMIAMGVLSMAGILLALGLGWIDG